MKKGFTLIELILTISIIIIILSVGIYKSSIVSDYEALKSMDELFENLRYSRNLAISQKIHQKLHFLKITAMKSNVTNSEKNIGCHKKLICLWLMTSTEEKV
ncbi:prepilin-type N-terminal cleavage/methylation domain-containing protein [Peptoniphilus sp. oral taxon 386]|uniref:prepilin-type N-terminal cleavage/methylation domain-containing protein n=1 Tax=Peptoniphilus sp. oral taxon 386 TaxID=652713 RepID=UPI0001DA9AE3|nr:prepilin-type N-terminal cleavage/methylation domain-containing protein [Peptoniphilus sp. oral taxon 386]EFI42045.1 prepilin-type cleavage/methylation N-terminal domain protein [Peptoniphilus sp. oral taxon 386 str. F0131]